MKRFSVGFVLIILLFLAANILAAHLQSDCGLRGVLGTAGCADDISRVGFPWVFYEEGGFAYRNTLNIGVLWLDVGVGLMLALVGGLVAQRLPRGIERVA